MIHFFTEIFSDMATGFAEKIGDLLASEIHYYFLFRRGKLNRSKKESPDKKPLK